MQRLEAEDEESRTVVGRGHQRCLQGAAEVAKEADKIPEKRWTKFLSCKHPMECKSWGQQLERAATLEQHRDPSMHIPAAPLVLILSVLSTSMTLKEKHSLPQEKKNCFAQLLHQAGAAFLSSTSFSASNCYHGMKGSRGAFLRRR